MQTRIFFFLFSLNSSAIVGALPGSCGAGVTARELQLEELPAGVKAAALPSQPSGHFRSLVNQTGKKKLVYGRSFRTLAVQPEKQNLVPLMTDS